MSEEVKQPPRDADDGEFKVADKRHWAAEEDAAENGESGAEEAEAEVPVESAVIEAYRNRTETAEQKLQEYIEAFKKFKEDQESFRQRMERDVERKIELKFGDVVREFLASIDDLDLALGHVAEVPEAQPLAEGVRLARKRIVSALEQQGVQQLAPLGEPFDPNEAEALRMDPVDSKDQDGRVTEILQPGYRLGELVIRAARVAVGRHSARG